MKRISNKLNNQSSLLESCLVNLNNSVRESFKREGFFGDSAFTEWASHSDITRELRKRHVKGKRWHGEGKSLLKDSYKLKNELTAHPVLVSTREGSSVALKTNDKNAKRQDEGFWSRNIFKYRKKIPTKVPARPVYSFSPEEVDKLMKKTFDYFT